MYILIRGSVLPLNHIAFPGILSIAAGGKRFAAKRHRFDLPQLRRKHNYGVGTLIVRSPISTFVDSTLILPTYTKLSARVNRHQHSRIIRG
ncbi:hypothetical protein DTO212C5_7108 [Paecilomyces variotii]|nr:hypothetical protein DTO212C5_7108 [Paecilomyces variotii]